MPGYRPRKYDPNAQYKYHMGQQGHATDNCWELKNKVQDLIDANLVQLDFVESEGHTVNMICTGEVDTGHVQEIDVDNQGQSDAEGERLPTHGMIKKQKDDGISRERAYQSLEGKVADMAERVEALEWIVKYVLDRLQDIAPNVGGASHTKAQRNIVGLDKESGPAKRKQSINTSVQKVSSHDKPSGGV